MMVSCGFVILNVNKKVLIAHPTNDYSGEGIWTLPKGLIEENETPLECAFREVFEETNLDLTKIDGEIRYLGNSIQNNREVILFEFKSKEDLRKYDIKCNSLVENYVGFEEPFYENDDFKWVSIYRSYNYLSSREQNMLKEHYL